ncbi:hypothetical protein [Roseivirga pacifica]|uniref:hypothetical protein n=1 Tax=Roseivirga pacifica TaxID=1267423 RepID=UPI0020958A46|nr:hypothetical protein [Roseivirga pacifica]MCO6358566.1 hypothetical protein [Roseivirga pacifica]MCO6366642.1 hypothetical protein [Roseivirga pacifica]MCO6369306.1 hypothetical protein [Roseivirga pacifica]MCO6374310.1 hypothetical protein [Roseivirga pacifica]MCO6378498.1 hypothetical protein [Roseivirga pacifica]
MRDKIKDLVKRLKEEMQIQHDQNLLYQDMGNIKGSEYSDGKYGACMVIVDELEEILNSENKIS